VFHLYAAAVRFGSREPMVRLGFTFEVVVEVCDPLNPIYGFVSGSAILEVAVAPGDTAAGADAPAAEG